MKLTKHNGRAGKNGVYNPKHNDRNFDVSNSEPNTTSTGTATTVIGSWQKRTVTRLSWLLLLKKSSRFIITPIILITRTDRMPVMKRTDTRSATALQMKS